MWVVGGPGGCCAGDSHRRGPALARLIGRCLGKHPARRPSDADALRELGSTSSASAAATRPASGGAGSASLLQIGARRGVAPGRLLTPLRGRQPRRPAGAVGARSCPRRADRTGCRPKGDEMPVTSLSTCKECNRRSPQLGGEEDHRARTATRSVVNEPLCFPKYCSSLSEPGECRTHTPSTEVVPYLRYDFSPRTEHVRKYCSRRCAGKGSMAARRATERAQREERARNRARSGAAA